MLGAFEFLAVTHILYEFYELVIKENDDADDADDDDDDDDNNNLILQNS